MFFFFNDTATTEIYTLSLHDALPIYVFLQPGADGMATLGAELAADEAAEAYAVIDQLAKLAKAAGDDRSEEHTSELQSRQYLVCRLLLEKKKTYART